MRACWCTLPYSDPSACARCGNNSDLQFNYNHLKFGPCPTCGDVRKPCRCSLQKEIDELKERLERYENP